MKQQFLVDKADTIRLTVYENNRKVVPSSGNVTLYKPGGSELQAQTAVTVGSDGEMTYALTATHTDIADLNYRALWDYVVNGTTHYQTQLFDVVKSVLSIPITDDDLYNELDSLRDVAIQETGIATAGAAGTLTDTTNRKEGDDYWTGGRIEIIDGTGEGQARDVSDFVQSTSVISVSPNWTTNPDTTSRYRVIRAWTQKIQQSFTKIETMLREKGKRHQLILESSQIEMLMIYLTIHSIALDLRKDIDDTWDLLQRDYGEKFEKAFANLTLEYDEDDSLTIQGDEEEMQNVNAFTIGRS